MQRNGHWCWKWGNPPDLCKGLQDNFNAKHRLQQIKKMQMEILSMISILKVLWKPERPISKTTKM